MRSIDGNISGVRGYSPLPISTQANLYPGIQLDGVVITAAVFGSNNYSNPVQTFPLVPNYPPNTWDLIVRNQGKILAHEVGHYLNLFHTFQGNLNTNQTCVGVGANCSTDGDFICITNPVLMPNSTYINGSPLPSTCSNPGPDDVGNFMYYADDVTLSHFNQGQVNWMLTHLFNFRPGLITVPNLNKWGLIGNGCINNGVFADFTITGNHCLNVPLAFAPVVSIPTPNLSTNWAWTFGDGGTANIQNPSHTYNNVGTYTITCTSSDGSTTNISTSTKVVTITPCGLNPNYIRNAHWYYGQYIGLDFTSGVPVFNNAALVNQTVFAPEGAYSFSDNAGNLVFYTDGINLWDANHIQINNGPIFSSTPQDFFNNNQTNQQQEIISVYGIMAVPFPGHPNMYFLFCSPALNITPTQSRFVIVDLNGPNPNVSIAQTFTPNGIIMGEGLGIVPHCSGVDFWVVTHSRTGNQNFYSYLISEYGISASPVISANFTTSTTIACSIKFSSDNSKLAYAGGFQGIPNLDMGIYDFNNSTGVVTNEIFIDAPNATQVHGCSFTSDVNNNFLYFLTANPMGLWQYNIIANTTVQIVTPPNFASFYMQLAPDDNIYLSSTPFFNQNILHRISNPNTIPSYTNNILTFPPFVHTLAHSLPNLMDGVQPPSTSLTMNLVYISCSDVELTVPACWNGYDYDINWGDGSPNQQSTNLPTNVTHTYVSTGTYTITLSLLPPGQTTLPVNPIQVTQVINILDPNTPIAGDATPCLNTTLPQTYTVPQLLNASYLWTTSANGSILGPNNSHQVNVDWTAIGAGNISVTIISGACTLNLSLTINVLANPVASITNGNPCSMPAQLTASPINLVNYVWNGPVSGTGNPFTATSNGTYIVTVTDVNGCEDFASITVAPMPVQTFVNPLASTILAFYPLSVNNTIINATFGIDGVLTMDADLTFQVCNIFMAPDAEIQVGGNHTITFMDNCVVQTPAQCPMWKGIFANGIGNNVVVYGSTFKDMKTGLQIQAGAGLEADGSSFIDNYISIHLKNQSNTYGSITNNTFETDVNFLKDPYLNQLGEHGIILENCSSITIGDPNNPTNKNHFENLYNGIYIRDAVALSSTNTITTSLNTFKKIIGGTSLMGVASPPWGTPYNMQYRGTAIFGNSSIQTNNLWLKHYGHNNTTVDFDACTKAILLNAFNTEIHKNRVASTVSSIQPEAGFLTYKNEGKVIYIRFNTILNTILGINLNATAMFCDVHGNNISTNSTYDLSGYPPTFFTTKGINLDEFANVPIDPDPNNPNPQQGKYIDYNTLTINNLAAGEGINVLKTRWGSIHDNVIHFASNDPSADNTSRPSLVGIRLNKVDLSRVMNNNVVLDNHANTTILQNRKTIGIELYESPSNIFDCNTNDYLHWGMQVRGDCAITQPDHFKQNFFRTYYFGIYSTNLSAQGYLGRDIGFYDPTLGGYKFDANNQFANALNASNKRLFRFLPTTTTNCDNAKIVKYHTTSSPNRLINGALNHSESAGGSGAANSCKDVIVNPPFNPSEIAASCVPIQNNIMGEEDGGEPITDNPDVEGMIDIAQDSVLYSEYPELGEWYDERRLMDMLTTHDSLRLQYPILNTFYMQRQQGNLDKLNKIDRYLGMLSDSATIANSANYAYNLQQAIQLNNELNSTEYYVQNEKWINTLYMRRWDVGNDTINETEAEAIDALASECPYVAGNAVYKARMLNAYYFPTKQYNDKVICNAIGVFKNDKGLFDDEEAYLDSIMNVKINGLVASELIKVYPNPATETVTIEFESIIKHNAQFELLDLSGRVVMKEILLKGTKSNKLKLPTIANGLYTYKIIFDNTNTYNGKLIKN